MEYSAQIYTVELSIVVTFKLTSTEGLTATCAAALGLPNLTHRDTELQFVTGSAKTGLMADDRKFNFLP